MGSSRKYLNTPPPPAHGWGSYNGKDMENPNAVFPSKLMPENQPYNGGNNQQQNGMNFGGYSVNAAAGLEKAKQFATSYSPFFMRF